jgi:hypothetical protein
MSYRHRRQVFLGPSRAEIITCGTIPASRSPGHGAVVSDRRHVCCPSHQYLNLTTGAPSSVTPTGTFTQRAALMHALKSGSPSSAGFLKQFGCRAIYGAGSCDRRYHGNYIGDPTKGVMFTTNGYTNARKPSSILQVALCYKNAQTCGSLFRATGGNMDHAQSIKEVFRHVLIRLGAERL